MDDTRDSPLFDHPTREESAFTAEALLDSVRRLRQVPEMEIPPVCILEFDGDLTDWLVDQGLARPCLAWACFHTTLLEVALGPVRCGIIARTIGGPYAVLIAEQLRAAGVKLIFGLTSAGRLAPGIPLPSLVVVTGAVRDEGTSLHYLPPGKEVACPAALTVPLERHLTEAGFTVTAGRVWTTDAPYRETPTQLRRWAADGVLAVEMQAASLLAFAQAREAKVAVVAMVSNAVDHAGEQFDTGSQQHGFGVLKALAGAAAEILGG